MGDQARIGFVPHLEANRRLTRASISPPNGRPRAVAVKGRYRANETSFAVGRALRRPFSGGLRGWCALLLGCAPSASTGGSCRRGPRAGLRMDRRVLGLVRRAARVDARALGTAATPRGCVGGAKMGAARQPVPFSRRPMEVRGAGRAFLPAGFWRCNPPWPDSPPQGLRVIRWQLTCIWRVTF